MAVNDFDAPFAMIFNFDKYAGNFEREFCAFVTGSIGECGVGEKLAELFHEDHPESTLNEITQNVMDDGGCARPVSIYHDTVVDATPYESAIIFFLEQPTPEECELVIARAKKFCAERPDSRDYLASSKVPLHLRGARLVSNKVVRTQEVMVNFL